VDPTILIATFGPAVATVLVGVVSAVVPFVYIEVYLFAVVALVPAGPATWMLGPVAAVGQMLGKSALYWAARGVTSVFAPRGEPPPVNGLRQRMAVMRPVAVHAITFASALLGFPPFILVAPAAGAAAVRFWPFMLVGFAGRVLRFTALVLAASGLERLVVGGWRGA
jgi:membrane protein YqaA with SNARE-associated domain